MAVYDTSVALACIRGNEEACKLMSEDPECMIPPTATSEIWSFKHKLPSNCKLLTYDDPPFDDPSVATEPAAFVYAVEKVFMSPPKRGRRREWEVSERTKNYFRRFCVGIKNGKIDENDWRIVKEANVLAELDYIEDKRLISNDKHITNDFCRLAYEHVMSYLDEITGSEPEKMEVEIVPFREAIHHKEPQKQVIP